MASTTLVPAGILLLLIAGLYQLYQKWVDTRALAHIPTHYFTDDNSRKRYMSELKALLESGYRKYSTQGQPFKVRVVSGYRNINYRVILPIDHIDEIKHLSNNTFSWQLASHIIFAGDYSGAPNRGPWSGKALRVGIHQNLNEITRQLDREIDHYFTGYLTQDRSTPQSINLIGFLVPAIATVNNLLLVDERLSSDPEWIKATAAFAKNRYDAADDVRAWPPLLAPMVAPLLSSVREMKASKEMVRRRLKPLYEALKAEDGIKGAERKDKRKGSFGYEWLWSGAPEDIELNDFADTMMRTLIASIHTTAKTVSIALVDLLTQTEYIPELREEAIAAMGADGQIDIDKLVRLDCFLKESQRLQPVFLLTMNRIVTRPYQFKSSGLMLPKSTMTSAATSAVATDPSTFKDPNTFDGRRFYQLRQDNKGAESHYNMGMATEDSLGFGLGSQACPARFFATAQMKILLSRLLIGWDMTLEKNGEEYLGSRPDMEYLDFSVKAPAEYGIRLVKR